jgi:hypothetical protein
MKMNTVLRNALFSLAGMGLLFMPVSAQVFKGVPQYSNGPVSGLVSVPLSYNGPETLNLSATVSTGTVTVPLGGGTASGVISVTTQYNLNPGRVVTIEAGFNTPVALSDGNGDTIPAEAITATFSGAGGTVTNYPSCMGPSSNQTAIQFGYSCGYITFPTISPKNTSATHTHTIAMGMQPWFELAPGNYTGTLLIAAQAN